MPTKRSIVSLVGRFYDPIGYLAPVVVQFKIFLRELCQSKIDWDQHLPSELMDGWNTLSESLQCSQPLSIPRCYLDGIPEQLISCTLWGFCDASQNRSGILASGNRQWTLCQVRGSQDSCGIRQAADHTKTRATVSCSPQSFAVFNHPRPGI